MTNAASSLLPNVSPQMTPMFKKLVIHRLLYKSHLAYSGQLSDLNAVPCKDDCSKYNHCKAKYIMEWLFVYLSHQSICTAVSNIFRRNS